MCSTISAKLLPQSSILPTFTGGSGQVGFLDTQCRSYVRDVACGIIAYTHPEFLKHFLQHFFSANNIVRIQALSSVEDEEIELLCLIQLAVFQSQRKSSSLELTVSRSRRQLLIYVRLREAPTHKLT